MKRLLAAGSGDIWQMGRVFRDGEAGRRHNVEFTLLEWYRTGWTLERLMAEVETLIREVCAGHRGLAPARHFTYREAFLAHAGIDPLIADAHALEGCARSHGVAADLPDDESRVVWLDLLMSHVVEPAFADEGLVFVRDFPAACAALARIRPGDPPVAARFECWLDGMEIANGFHELADAAEQRARFEADNAERRRRGLQEMPIDERFLAALAAGLPDCAGVALGVDRLVMAALGARHIDEVIAFPMSVCEKPSPL